MLFDMLREEGVNEETIREIHAPIGLSIGAETPEEIGVSIAAEIIQVRSSRGEAASHEASAVLLHQ